MITSTNPSASTLQGKIREFYEIDELCCNDQQSASKPIDQDILFERSEPADLLLSAGTDKSKSLGDNELLQQSTVRGVEDLPSPFPEPVGEEQNQSRGDFNLPSPIIVSSTLELSHLRDEVERSPHLPGPSGEDTGSIRGTDGLLPSTSFDFAAEAFDFHGEDIEMDSSTRWTIIAEKESKGEIIYLVKRQDRVDQWLKYNPTILEFAEAIEVYNSRQSVIVNLPKSANVPAMGQSGLRKSARQQRKADNQPLEGDVLDIQNISDDSDINDRRPSAAANIRKRKRGAAFEKMLFCRGDDDFFSKDPEDLVYEVVELNCDADFSIDDRHSPFKMADFGKSKGLLLYYGDANSFFKPCDPVWGGDMRFSPVIVEKKRGSEVPDWRFHVGFGQKLIFEVSDPVNHYLVGAAVGPFPRDMCLIVYNDLNDEDLLMAQMGQTNGVLQLQDLKDFPLRRYHLGSLMTAHVPKAVETILDSTKPDRQRGFFEAVRGLFSEGGKLPHVYYLKGPTVCFLILLLTDFFTILSFPICRKRAFKTSQANGTMSGLILFKFKREAAVRRLHLRRFQLRYHQLFQSQKRQGSRRR
jgi:hypothetical protein